VLRSLRWTLIDEPMMAEMQRQGWTPSREELGGLLNRALTFDEVAVATALLDLGADANQRPVNEEEPLFVARSAAATRALLSAGANPFLPSLVYRAAYGDAARVALLIKAGAPVDVADVGTSLTPLMVAANAGNAAVVEVLLAAGANPAATARGKSALDLARDSRRAYEHMAWLPIPPDFSRVIELLERALRAGGR
jgi:ankyrin repeat protein